MVKIIKENELDLTSPVPLHFQLSEILTKEIQKGALLNHVGKIPTEKEIGQKFQVSRITVRRAVQNLVDKGFLKRERGRGTFLKTNEIENWSGRLMGFSELIEAQGYKPSSSLIAKGLIEDINEDIQISLDSSSLWQLKRLRFGNEQPIAIENSIFPSSIGLEFEKEDLETILTYQFIEKNLGIILSEGEQVISAKKANLEEADLLNVEENDPLISVKRVSYSINHKPIEYLEAAYRPDYFQYFVKLTRNK